MDANHIKELTEYFDTRYVRKDDCSVRHERTEAEITEIRVNQAKNTTQLSAIIKIGVATLIAVIGLLCDQIGGVIFK